VDAFRKASPAVKLMLSTIPLRKSNGDTDISSIYGYKLLPASKAYITIKNRVHSARTPDEMMRMLKELGEEDPTYNTVYNRIMGNASSISEIKDKNRERLLAAFWKTFKAQNADVKIVYVLEDNVLEVGDSNLNTAARQISSEFTNGLV